MNHHRMISAAEWMLRIHEAGDKFNLNSWQTSSGGVKKTYESAHTCGATCCFGGWLGLNTDFKAAGGRASHDGSPVFDTESGFNAIAKYLEIGRPHALLLASPALSNHDESYGKDSGAVAALDVADLLLKMIKEDLSLNKQKRGIPRIGEFWQEQGGIFIGEMRGENGQPNYQLILPIHPRTSFERVCWGEYGNEIPGCDSKRDGLANTIAMADSGSALAKQIRGLEIDGFSDFYLPSRYEAFSCFLRAAEQFKTDNWYWTSTQCSSNSAWVQVFSDGYQGNDGKDNEFRARAVRRLII